MRLLVIRHEDWKTYYLRAASRRKHRNLGLFEPVLRRLEIPFEYIEAPTGARPSAPIGSYSHLLILGGAMGAYEEDRHAFLRDERALIEEAIARGLPVLGICLGAQLLARALGAAVYPGPRGAELGWHDLTLTAAGEEDALLSVLPTRTRVLQWHSDTFDLPPRCVHLAASEAYPYQAFRYEQHVWGLQFHAEAGEEIIRTWLREKRAVVGAGDGAGAMQSIMQTIAQDTPRFMPGHQALSERLFERFLQQGGRAAEPSGPALTTGAGPPPGGSRG